MHTKFSALSPMPVKMPIMRTTTTTHAMATPTFAAKYAAAESTSSTKA
jgi:hypothetical protein